MLKKLVQIQSEAADKIQSCDSLKDLNDLRVLYLGKKGPIQEAMKAMKDLAKEERAKVGQVSNQVKQEITSLIEKKKVLLEEAAIEAAAPAAPVETTDDLLREIRDLLKAKDENKEV